MQKANERLQTIEQTIKTTEATEKSITANHRSPIPA